MVAASTFGSCNAMRLIEARQTCSSLIEKRKEPEAYYSWAIYPKKAGRIVSIGVPDLDSHCEWDWRVEVGATTLAARHMDASTEFAGYLVYHNADYERLYKDFLALREFDPIVVE